MAISEPRACGAVKGHIQLDDSLLYWTIETETQLDSYLKLSHKRKDLKMYKRGTTPEWDIRTMLGPETENENDLMQVGYDMINCKAMLLKDISLHEFFHTQWSVLLPIIAARIGDAYEYGLVNDPRSVETCLNTLAANHGDVNWSAYLAGEHADAQPAIREQIARLWDLGLPLPIAQTCKAAHPAMVRALTQFTEALQANAETVSLTYSEFYEAKTLPEPFASTARSAIEVGLLDAIKQRYCCWTDTLPHRCVFSNNLAHWCSYCGSPGTTDCD